MDFPQFVTDHLARLGEDDPTAIFGEEGQMLLGISRQQDLDSRAGMATQEPQDSNDPNEVTDVDELAMESSSLTQMSEPATDSAIFTQPESLDEAEPADTEQPAEQQAAPEAIPEQFVQNIDPLVPEVPDANQLDQAPEAEPFTPDAQDGMGAQATEPGTGDSADEAIPSEFLQEQTADATANEAVALGNSEEAVAENPVSSEAEPSPEPFVPTELEQSPEAIPEQLLEPISAGAAEITLPEELPPTTEATINRTSEIIDVPEHLQPVFNEILAHADSEVHGTGFQTSIVEPGVELPPLPEIHPELTDRGSVINAQSLAMMERERL